MKINKNQQNKNNKSNNNKPIVKQRPKNQVNLVKELARKVGNYTLGMPSSYSHYAQPTYLQSLLYPECVHGCKIPGRADSTIAIRRKATYNLTTNGLGAAGIVWYPNTLSDNSSQQTTFYINTNSTYDGVTTVGSAGPLAVYLAQACTAGSTGQFRLVSAAMHIIPQSSVLNQAGSIHATMMKGQCPPPVSAGAALVPTQSINTLLPNLENSIYYREASVSAMEGARIIWVPNDECLLEFTDTNTNVANEQNGDIQVNGIFADIVGTAALAPFRVDLYWNFEVTSVPGSILQGMESINPDNTIAPLVWRDLLLAYPEHIVTCNKSIANSVVRNSTQMKESSSIPSLSRELGISNSNEARNGPYLETQRLMDDYYKRQRGAKRY
jgi:hypothetical protein